MNSVICREHKRWWHQCSLFLLHRLWTKYVQTTNYSIRSFKYESVLGHWTMSLMWKQTKEGREGKKWSCLSRVRYGTTVPDVKTPLFPPEPTKLTLICRDRRRTIEPEEMTKRMLRSSNASMVLLTEYTPNHTAEKNVFHISTTVTVTLWNVTPVH